METGIVGESVRAAMFSGPDNYPCREMEALRGICVPDIQKWLTALRGGGTDGLYPPTRGCRVSGSRAPRLPTTRSEHFTSYREDFTMAKIDPSNRIRDRKEHGGGGGNYPTFTQEEGSFPTCISIAHTRSKKAGGASPSCSCASPARTRARS